MSIHLNNFIGILEINHGSWCCTKLKLISFWKKGLIEHKWDIFTKVRTQILESFCLRICFRNVSYILQVNPFELSFSFHIKTSNFICSANLLFAVQIYLLVQNLLLITFDITLCKAIIVLCFFFTKQTFFCK